MWRFRWRLKSRTLSLGERTLIMGVLNVTPDSFSDGGKFSAPDAAIARALEIEHQGADILDIGGESTRPGSKPISSDEEISRVLPVLRSLRGRLRIAVSIDTRRADVAEAALAEGAEIVNDVSALQFDARMKTVVSATHAGLVLMHMRGRPESMQQGPFARDVFRDVTAGLRLSIRLALRSGISRAKIAVDPGIGFGKNYTQNFELLARLQKIAKLGYPVLIGVSRKAFLGAAISSAENPASASERIWGTAACVTAAILHGANIVRVHDVAEMAQVARVADRLRRSL